MNFDVVIPSFRRKEKLQNCLNSILKITDKKVNVYVYFSDELDYCEFNGNYNNSSIEFRIFNNYRVPTFWNTHLKNMTNDVMICLNDDVLVDEDFFKKLEERFKLCAYGLDCIIGINQKNIEDNNKLDSAFCAIGSEYANRFPDRQVYCPDYYRFYADKEIGEFAKSINRFFYSSDIKITHLHPSIMPQFIDETHYRVRTFLDYDRIIYDSRKQLRLLWGKDFTLLKDII